MLCLVSGNSRYSKLSTQSKHLCGLGRLTVPHVFYGCTPISKITFLVSQQLCDCPCLFVLRKPTQTNRVLKNTSVDARRSHNIAVVCGEDSRTAKAVTVDIMTFVITSGYIMLDIKSQLTFVGLFKSYDGILIVWLNYIVDMAIYRLYSRGHGWAVSPRGQT